MDNSTKLQHYLPMVSFLSAVCGDRHEVILYDAADLSHSIVAIYNGQLSGQTLGGPMPETARKLLRERIYEKRDFVANHQHSVQNGKQFLSSTFFIKEEGCLTGLVCVNHDTSDLTAMARHLNRLMKSFSLPGEGETPSPAETDDSISDLSTSLIRHTVLDFGIPPERMTALEKEAVVRLLDRQGVFSTRGSVARTAQELNTSEPTIYRYLRRIRSQALRR